MQNTSLKSKIYANKRKAHSRKARRRGSTIVLMALSMVTLLGFGAVAVDYGLLVNDANRAQRTADAAALAGANELCKTGGCDTTVALVGTTEYNRIEYDKAQARYIAGKVASENGLAVTDANIQLTPNLPGVPARSVRVTPQVNRGLFFARALGASNASLSRTARAGRLPLSGLTGASPLAITTTDYHTYKNGTSFEVVLIRNQDTDFAPGTAASLDLRLDNSGKSGAVFQDDLQYGYSGPTVLGQPINSALTADEGSQGKKLEDAFNHRIDRAKGAPWYDNGNYQYPNYPVGDPRIVTIMVALPSPANNNNPVLNARAFVNVYIEQVRSPGHKATYVRMRILPNVGYSSMDPDIIVGGENDAITGPSAVVLLN